IAVSASIWSTCAKRASGRRDTCRERRISEKASSSATSRPPSPTTRRRSSSTAAAASAPPSRRTTSRRWDTPTSPPWTVAGASGPAPVPRPSEPCEPGAVERARRGEPIERSPLEGVPERQIHEPLLLLAEADVDAGDQRLRERDAHTGAVAVAEVGGG